MPLRSLVIPVLFLVTSWSAAQTVTQLGPDVDAHSAPNSTITEMDADGTIYVGYMDSGQDPHPGLTIKKYSAGNWVSIGTIVEDSSGLQDFDMKINSLTQELQVVYVKTDGLYVTSYDGSWSTPAYYSLQSEESPYSYLCQLTIDPDAHAAYITHCQTGTGISLLRFDDDTGIFTGLPVPPVSDALGGALQASRICYNTFDNHLYFSNGREGIYWYDGTGWNTLVEDFTSYNNYHARMEVLPSGNHDLVLAYSTEGSNEFRVGVASFSTGTGTETVLQPTSIVSAGVYSTHLSALAISPLNGFIACSYQTSSPASYGPVIRIYNNEDWYEVPLNFPDGVLVEDLDFDQNGTLYITMTEMYNAPIAVYTFSTGYLSADKLTDPLQELFPNPSTGTITFKSTERGMFTIVDFQGKRLLGAAIENDSQTIDLSGLAAGVYLARFETKNGEMSTRQIVKY